MIQNRTGYEFVPSTCHFLHNSCCVVARLYLYVCERLHENSSQTTSGPSSYNGLRIFSILRSHATRHMSYVRLGHVRTPTLKGHSRLERFLNVPVFHIYATFDIEIKVYEYMLEDSEGRISKFQCRITNILFLILDTRHVLYFQIRLFIW